MITEKIGKFGFGLMRLPKKDDKIDMEQVKAMVDMFMEAGFNYFDTAWAYGESESATRQALFDRYPRDKFIIATKCAAWINCKTREDAVAQFEHSLETFGTDYIDFYLLHSLGQSRTKVFEEFDLWNYFGEMKRHGRIRHLGFSFHGSAQELDDILTSHPEAEFVQLQINYADWEDHVNQSRMCYEVARRHNVPIIAMEPVKGGLLANPPEGVRDILKRAEPDSTPASWAIRFCAELEGVVTVLSGVSNIEQMRDTLSFMKGFDRFTDEQRRAVSEARRKLSEYPIIPCTSCDYCFKVCPMKIGISQTFTAANQKILYQDFAIEQLTLLIDAAGKKRATECTKCGRCEKACPQQIKIREELEKSLKLIS